MRSCGRNTVFFSKPCPTSSSAGISSPLMISSGGIVFSISSVSCPACSRRPFTMARCSETLSADPPALCCAAPVRTSGAAVVFAYASIYALQPTSMPISAQNERYAFISSSLSGLMIPELNPRCIAIAKNVEVTSSRRGRPNEILETPSTVCTPSLWRMVSSASSVIIALSAPVLTVMASVSIITSLRSMP